MEKNLPPHNPFTSLLQQSHIVGQHEDRKEPHILFMSHDLSRRMRIELDKRNMSFEEFVMQACMEYIKIIDEDSQCAIQSQSTAQSISDTFVSVDLNSSNEDKELADLLVNLQKLAFKKHKKDTDHEPLIKTKKRHSKDNKNYEKK